MLVGADRRLDARLPLLLSASRTNLQSRRDLVSPEARARVPLKQRARAGPNSKQAGPPSNCFSSTNTAGTQTQSTLVVAMSVCSNNGKRSHGFEKKCVLLHLICPRLTEHVLRAEQALARPREINPSRDL